MSGETANLLVFTSAVYDHCLQSIALLVVGITMVPDFKNLWSHTVPRHRSGYGHTVELRRGCTGEGAVVNEIIFKFKLNQYLANKLLVFWHFFPRIYCFGMEQITHGSKWEH